jgi:hypothetical protein
MSKYGEELVKLSVRYSREARVDTFHLSAEILRKAATGLPDGNIWTTVEVREILETLADVFDATSKAIKEAKL